MLLCRANESSSLKDVCSCQLAFRRDHLPHAAYPDRGGLLLNDGALICQSLEITSAMMPCVETVLLTLQDRIALIKAKPEDQFTALSLFVEVRLTLEVVVAAHVVRVAVRLPVTAVLCDTESSKASKTTARVQTMLKP